MESRDTRDTTVPTKPEPRAGYRAPALEVIELTEAIGGNSKPRGSGFVSK